MTPLLGLLRLATVASLLCFAHAQDVQFDDDIVSTFLESAETPMKTIKQRGKPQSIENPIRSIKRTGGDNGPSAKPVMHIITAPGCGACNHLKNSVNRGTEARELMGSFDVAYLNGPGGMPWTDKWSELGHEGYIPQVYFYSGQGRPLHVVNERKDEWNWHSFISESDLMAGMREAISRDNRIAGGEDAATVAPLTRQFARPPPPPPPPPPPADTTGCMEGWAGADCDECAPGYSGEDCDVKSTLPPSPADLTGCMEGWAGADCDECAPSYSGEDCDVKSTPPPPPPSPVTPADYTDCDACISAGFGWSTKKKRCGAGYANRKCPASEL